MNLIQPQPVAVEVVAAAVDNTVDNTVDKTLFYLHVHFIDKKRITIYVIQAAKVVV